MKIKEFRVRNFRSLKKVSLEQLEDLVVLIGENNAGKTNILEALYWFSSQFSWNAGSHLRRLEKEDYYLWFKGITRDPIEFQAVLELDEKEIEELTKITKKQEGRLLAEVKMPVGREIKKGDLEIKRALVCKDESLYQQNDLIRWNSITLEREEEGGISRFVSKEEVSFDLSSFPQTVDRLIKESFSYIPLGRETKSTKPHDIILDPGLKDEIVKKGEDSSPPGMRSWSEWIMKRRRWIPEQVECKEGRIILRKGKEMTPFLYELEGGGRQAGLNLIEQIEKGKDIIAIEEPENHLHPRLQKQLLKEIEGELNGKKQIFIATHSPFIVDQANLKSLWFVWEEEMKSKVANIATAKELGNALWTIGVKPSDFLFANGVMVVEGPTDKDVYADWARKIGKPFEEVGILVIDAEGCKNITKYLNSKVIQRTTFKLYCLADRNADWVKEKVESVVPKDNMLFLDKGDLEDYYHHDIVLPFAREMALKRGKKKEEIPSEIKVGETVKTLNNLLGGDWWKRPLADKVISEMTFEQIDDEIKDKLDRILGDLER